MTLPVFDDAAYVRANPDVRDAIARGEFPCGREHWVAFGEAEGRPLDSLHDPLSRREKLLDGIDLERMVGIEIGALTRPIVTKAEAMAGIYYVDHADTATLRSKYPTTEIDHDQLVEVDFVWGESSLQSCIGEGRQVDFVVNSHVIEHVPDLVTWLAEIRAVLKPGGHLRIAIPDRRFTFDVRRRESTLADVLDAAIRRPRTPSPRAILDHFLNVSPVDKVAAWRGDLALAALAPAHTPGEALQHAERAWATGAYQDTHCWVFTPLSFAELCGDLAALGKLELACVVLYPTEFLDLEFIVAMRPSRDAAECVESWRGMARRIREMAGSVRRLRRIEGASFNRGRATL